MCAWIVHLLVGRGSDADPQELLQDTFVNIYRYAGSFREDGGRTFRAWARTIAANVVRRARLRGRPTLSFEAMPSGTQEPADVHDGPSETVDTINRLSDEAGMAPVSGFEAARAQFLSREPAFAARAMVIDGTARRVQPRARPSSAFVVEDRIFHQKFGYGTVRSVDNDKLTIDFDHSGEKRVMDSFVVAAKDAG